MSAAIIMASSICAQVPREAEAQAVITRYCTSCHNEKLTSGKLNLDASARHSPETWEKVLDKVNSRKMPPPGLPAPTAGELALLTNWISSVTGTSAAAAAPDPGRVTARRLNRLEYNNTVRDLLKVHVRPADQFPVDNSGYGFDNIGDVLSLSPILMDKYLTAARKISKLAVYGETVPPKPVTLGHYVTKRSPDTTGSVVGPGTLPYLLRGALYGTHLFPWAADYEFRFRVVNFRYILRPRGSPPLTPEEAQKLFPPVDAVLTIDGKRIASTSITGSLAYEFDRGDIVFRTHLSAGEHDIRISFPHLADIENPRDNVNVDQRRKLWIDYLDIVGPFNARVEPPDSYKHIFDCGHPVGGHEDACIRTAVSKLARGAYRRPVTNRELDKLLALTTLARKQGESIEESVRVALQAILVSPQFLFRIEQQRPANDAGTYAISEHELASRLSYFLWGSMPDKTLFRLAAQNQLRKPDVLEGQVRRMLADPKSAALVDGFAAQWLQLRSLDRAKPDLKRFPKVDEELLSTMRRETNLFVSTIVQEDRSVLDFLDAPFTWVNGPLAKHYGISGVAGEEFRRVSLEGGQRGGLMTQASVLTVSSYPTRTSPVLRGKWVLDNILGAPPAPPPPDVPELQSENLDARSLRQQLEQHRANPSCATCHDQMDPLGFGLETYDAVGAWRTHDGKFPVDASGTLPGGATFNGPRELISILRSRPEQFVRSLSERLLTYALGRGLERYDTPAVTLILERTAAQGHRFSALVLEIVKSVPFQMARGAKPDSGGHTEVKGGGNDHR